MIEIKKNDMNILSYYLYQYDDLKKKGFPNTLVTCDK